MEKEVTILTGEPTIELIAVMKLLPEGIEKMMGWVGSHRPECLPDGEDQSWRALFPHQLDEEMPNNNESMVLQKRPLTDNELLVEFAGRKCYDGQTEVLTDSGWVSFENLRLDDAVACFSAERGEIVFEVPTDYIRKKYTGPMYCVESRALSIRVTPDHDMWALHSGVWEFAPANQLAGKEYGIRRAAVCLGEEFSEELWPVPPEKRAAWAAFLGYFLSEGSLVDGKTYGTGSRVIIYQQQTHMAPILLAIAALGLDPYVKVDPRNDVAAITLNNTLLADALREACGHGSENKRIPRHVFKWPLGLRAILLDALMFGDGTAGGAQRVYRTSSERLASDVQQLILMSGKPGSISFSDHALRTPYPTSFKSNFPMYSVREGEHTVVTVNNKARHDWQQEDADELVYCVTVPSRILVLRRNRKVFFCSNCYDSFGKKAGKKTNREYILNTQQGDIPHASILYHAKMSFFFAGISRRVSHEIIRNYVGADRDEEGAPSQESTRFTHHYGFFIAPPKYLDESQLGPKGMLLAFFRDSMQLAYGRYLEAVRLECEVWEKAHHGKPPTSIDKKRIYEAASSFLPHQAETSFIWTTNPAAIAKLVRERANNAADLEIQRFARKLRDVAFAHSPNLFPMPWMNPSEAR